MCLNKDEKKEEPKSQNMLPKKNRLTRDKEFDRVFKNGKSSYNNIVGFKVINNNLNINRFGIIVGKKVSKKAVERNKIKRQIRAIIRSKKLEKIKQGYDCLIIALPKIKLTNYQTIEKSITNNFIKLKIF